MISFASDYAEGAHPKILERLIAINFEANPGYGTDTYCESARQKIRQACGTPHADVYFLVGGTQTNQTVIDALLPPYAGVLAVETGHIALHEAGAIEFTGHKVLTLASHEGKMEAIELENWLKNFYADGNHEHMVFPGLVYISHPTEYGTLYTKEELKSLYTICQNFSLPLYLDGARLAYGLASPSNDVSLPDIASYTDVFYIGGTKVGALLGEAVVFSKNNTPAHFFTLIKQHGALLAKGWILGLQFDTLFTDHLYEQIGHTALKHAQKIKEALKTKGYKFYLESPTNQIFLELENQKLGALQRQVGLSFWEKVDANHTVIRLATSWATTSTQVDSFLQILESLD